MLNRIALAFALLLTLGLALLGWSYAEATSTPVVRRAVVATSDWPARQPPLRIVLMSDIHVAGPDMPPERLRDIVAQVNGLRPDLVLIAGDLISEKRVATHIYSMAEAIAPLAALEARLGTVAVLGNHDHWFDARGAERALRKAGVILLANDAVRRGPVAVGGLDDDATGRADLRATLATMAKLRGAPLLLSHSPDPFPSVPARVGLMVAGHTHCGQVRPPLLGAVVTMSRHGQRYVCGLVREAGKTLIVSAGLGTSGLPLRLNAPPDLWLITLGPAR